MKNCGKITEEKKERQRATSDLLASVLLFVTEQPAFEAKLYYPVNKSVPV